MDPNALASLSLSRYLNQGTPSLSLSLTLMNENPNASNPNKKVAIVTPNFNKVYLILTRRRTKIKHQALTEREGGQYMSKNDAFMQIFGIVW